MDRKNFLKKASVLSLGSTVGGKLNATNKKDRKLNADITGREYWVNIMTKIAYPVLHALSNEKLNETMPVETRPDAKEDRKAYTHLEAFGRLMTGMAPWLELGTDGTDEGKLRAKYIDLARKSLAVAVDPQSPDFMNFNKAGSQPLVDAAFLAHALIKAPNELWHQSPDRVHHHVIDALKSSREIIPYNNNWVLFSAMIEAALVKFEAGGDTVRINLAVRAVESWYLGDGIYGDGSNFHWDYYNSYVIQPFMLTILNILRQKNAEYTSRYQKALKISRRYAEILERLIAPDGTFPAIGRSITYRYGAFQLLAQIAWMQQLPAHISPAQVRGSLTKVIRKVSEAPGTFDDEGWLTLGLYGHQPQLAEFYISTGSLYLCSAVFLPLGLPAKNAFWSAAPQKSISEEIWTGDDIPTDHHLEL